jgi:hypothetical protein
MLSGDYFIAMQGDGVLQKYVRCTQNTSAGHRL